MESCLRSPAEDGAQLEAGAFPRGVLVGDVQADGHGLFRGEGEGAQEGDIGEFQRDERPATGDPRQRHLDLHGGRQ